MLLIIELIMLVAGIWAVATGKLPSLLFGGSHYRLEGRGVRYLGVVLVLPIPVVLASSVVLALFLGEEASGYATILELIIVLGVGMAALIISRVIRQPSGAIDSRGDVLGSAPDIEAIIGKKAQGSLIYALLGGLGIAAIILCPLAFIRSGQALKMIDEHKVGEHYRKTAKAARILAAVILLFWAAIAVCVLSPVLIPLLAS